MTHEPVDKGEEEDIEKLYPWGNKTPTYSIWLMLFALNVIMLGIFFTLYIEIPFIQGENVFAGLQLEQKAHAQLTTGGSDVDIIDPPIGTEDPEEDEVDDQTKALVYCFLAIAANTAIVWVTKTVGKWLNSVERRCKRRKCKWWCLCCNKWHCFFVTVLKWVTYVITVAMTVITTVLVWVCFQGQNPLG